MTSQPPPVAVVIPAKDEAQRIDATIRAASAIANVDLVVVVDDGSSDETSLVARDAGADVVRHDRNQGKGKAMQTGAAYVARHEQATHALLFIDADLEESATQTGALVEPVVSGRADMTIAVLPTQKSAGGGRGFVVGLARRGIERLTGWTPTQPLSGMRCLTRDAFEAAQPLAHGWGVEVGLTVDVLRRGLTIEEVPCELHHRVTGTGFGDQLHRLHQYRDVWRALAVRRTRVALRRR